LRIAVRQGLHFQRAELPDILAQRTDEDIGSADRRKDPGD
jgi:hypothetical protein